MPQFTSIWLKPLITAGAFPERLERRRPASAVGRNLRLGWSSWLVRYTGFTSSAQCVWAASLFGASDFISRTL